MVMNPLPNQVLNNLSTNSLCGCPRARNLWKPLPLKLCRILNHSLYHKNHRQFKSQPISIQEVVGQTPSLDKRIHKTKKVTETTPKERGRRRHTTTGEAEVEHRSLINLGMLTSNCQTLILSPHQNSQLKIPNLTEEIEVAEAAGEAVVDVEETIILLILTGLKQKVLLLLNSTSKIASKTMSIYMVGHRELAMANRPKLQRVSLKLSKLT